MLTKAVQFLTLHLISQQRISAYPIFRSPKITYTVVNVASTRFVQDINAVNTGINNKIGSIYKPPTAKTLNRHIQSFFDEKCFISSTRRGDELRQSVTQGYTHGTLDHIHVLTILHLCAKSQADPSSLVSWHSMMDVLRRSPRIWNMRSISTALFALQNFSTDETSPAYELIGLVSERLQHASNSQQIIGQSIAMSLYGLKNFNSSSFIIRSLLSLLAKVIRRGTSASLSSSTLSNGASDNMAMEYGLTGQEVGNALYGLRYMSSDVSEVKDILNALSGRIFGSSARIEFSAQNVGMALFGLQNMTTTTTETVTLLQALLPHIRNAPVDHQAIGNALYGLQGMSSTDPTVRDVITVLGTAINGYSGRLDAHEIANAFFGLRSMTADSVEVRTVLAALARKVDAMSGSLSSESLGMLLSGMRGMDSAVEEVSRVLCAVTDRLRSESGVGSVRDPMSGRALAMSLYGLQSMSSSSPAVRGLFDAIVERMTSCHHSHPQTIPMAMSVLSGEEVVQCMRGLRGVDATDTSSQSLLTALSHRIHTNTITNTNLQEHVVTFSADDMCHAVYGMRLMDSSIPAVRTLLAALLHRAKEISPGLGTITPWSFSCALYGTQTMSPVCEEVEEVWTLLQQWLRPADRVETMTKTMTTAEHSHSPDNDNDRLRFTGQGFGMALFGLQRTSNRSPVAVGVLRALLSRMDSHIPSMDKQAVSMALYGLRGFSSDTREVRTVLRILSREMKRLVVVGEEKLDSRSVTMILSGLQHMDASLSEVTDVFRSVVELMPSPSLSPASRQSVAANTPARRIVEPLLDAEAVASATYSLRHHNADLPHIRSLLSRLSLSLVLLDRGLDHREADLINLGMRDKDREVPEVKGLVDSFLYHLESRGHRHFRDHLNDLGAQTWMPLLVGFFLLQEQINLRIILFQGNINNYSRNDRATDFNYDIKIYILTYLRLRLFILPSSL
eukprot:gene8335-17162_t